MKTVIMQHNHKIRGEDLPHTRAYRPVASFLKRGGRFPQIADLLQGLKIVLSSGCLGETSFFKIITIDGVTLWSKLESTW